MLKHVMHKQESIKFDGLLAQDDLFPHEFPKPVKTWEWEKLDYEQSLFFL